MTNFCIICGAPCKVKYCSPECAKEGAQLQRLRKKKKKYAGCNEDCFNCPYEDCTKPAGKIKTDEATKAAFNLKQTEYTPKRYVVELNSLGRAIPEIMRGFNF